MAKDMYYLKHDSNAAHDPKVESMLLRFGMEGYGRFWRLAEILREQADYHMPRKKWGLTTLAKIWGCQEGEADEYLEALISTFELIKCDGEVIWSDRICRDMIRLNKIREEAKRSADMRWQSKRIKTDSERNANASGNDSKAMRTDPKVMLSTRSKVSRERVKPFKGVSPLLETNQESSSSVISEPQFEKLKSSMPWNNHVSPAIPEESEPDFPALTPDELAELEEPTA